MRDLKGKGKQNAPFAIVEGTPLPFGVTKTEDGILFSVCIDAAKDYALLLYKKGAAQEEYRISMENGSRCGNIWYGRLTGLDASAYEYQLLLDGKPTVDRYAKALTNRTVFGKLPEADAVRGTFDTAEAFDWEGDETLEIPLHEIVAYGLHVRGFTMDKSSHVRHKGTFAGVTEKLSHLQKLGVNQIELMPAYDYFDVAALDDTYTGTGQRLNYWGYGDAFFFAPKASFAAGQNACAEMKEMVKACHRAGIEVVMEFYFPPKTNGHLILDCIRYWALAYHIDGFHLHADHTPLAEIATDPLLSRRKLYVSNLCGDALEDGAQGRAAVYQDDFLQTGRRFLKSDEDQVNGFMRCITAREGNASRINYIACHNGFTLYDLVSYDQKHNEANGEDNRDGSDYNYSWNCGAEGATRKKKVLSLRRQQMKNALMMLYLSQGVPLLMAGDELCNSQSGNNNAYCIDNELSWVQWNRSGQDRILSFCRKLIEIRKAHPVLHKADAVRMMDAGGCGFPDVSFHSEKAWYAQTDAYQRQIGVMFCEGLKKKSGGFQYDMLYAAYNFHWMPHEFALPKLPDGMEWAVLLNTGAEEEENVSEPSMAVKTPNQRMLTVPARTAMLLIGKQPSDESDA